MKYIFKVLKLAKKNWIIAFFALIAVLHVSGKLEFTIKYAQNMLGLGDRSPASK